MAKVCTQVFSVKIALYAASRVKKSRLLLSEKHSGISEGVRRVSTTPQGPQTHGIKESSPCESMQCFNERLAPETALQYNTRTGRGHGRLPVWTKGPQTDE